MISDVLQEEKNKISDLLTDISYTINDLQFFNIPDYQISEEFKERWNLKFKRFFSQIDNYKNNEFPIVVLGRWNSGKSTFINAILGEDILPSANRELTSILTKVYYGVNNSIIIHFKDGQSQNINKIDLKNYISYRGSKYSEQIKQVDIVSNSSFLKSGLCIIDTPGLNSISELNNAISFNIMPKANSIILTFSGTDVGGKDNLKLIEQVLRLNYDNLYNILFVITKIDTLSKEELDEAKESLMELIYIAYKQLKLSNKNKIKICMVSSYSELKYQQYIKHNIDEKILLNDPKLSLNNINNVDFLHKRSNFEKLYHILNDSILSSENKKNSTNNIFTIIHNFLTVLCEDFKNTYQYLSKSNNISLEENYLFLQRRVKIEEKIHNEGKKEIKNFLNRISDLEYNIKSSYNQTSRYNDEYSNYNVNKVINKIYIKLAEYVDNTPYAVLSKDKFAELNETVKEVSTKLVIDWMQSVTNLYDMELKKVVTKIAEIIEENSKQFEKTFMTKSKKNDLNIYNVRLKSNIILSDYLISLVSSTTIGVGFSSIGGVILPGIGVIVGGIIGVVVGVISTMLQLSNNIERKKVILKKRLYKYLISKDFKFDYALAQLFIQYKKVGELLNQYLDESLERVSQENTSFILNYNDTKKKYEEIETKIISDIKSIEKLLQTVDSIFSQFMENPNTP